MARIAAALLLALLASTGAEGATEPANGVRKVRDFIIYRDQAFYSAFPSLVVRKDGEILCAFRRAPDRAALWKAPGGTHTDPNSYLVLVRSRDGGATWTTEPELIYAHPLGGSQDPCMVQLKDGTIICTSYGWALTPPQAADSLKNTMTHGQFAFLGGYIMRSKDAGKTWQGPIVPPPLQGDATLDALGKPCPTYNRGAMMQTADGTLLWAVVRNLDATARGSSVHLIRSANQGDTWQYVCEIASDEKASFNETSLIQTANGDIVAFMRTADFEGKAAIARSTDGGKSFRKWEDGGFFGHPFHAVRLKDGRIFLVYGYRQAPFGIRARVLNSNATDFATAPEIVIRDDGGGSDLGYPWAGVLPDGKVMVAYYFNVYVGPYSGTRHIAGSILEP